jgi:cystathionine beta-lyase/cystathionine gamma-synthase
VIDLPAVADLAHQAGALVVVDNTLASPYLQQPLTLGADLVVYSTTKYLGGHSDVVGGAVVAREKELGDRLAWIMYITGGIAGPLDSWLVLRGIKTLSLRMEQHSVNALHLAQALERHPAVARVRYPGLPSHPQHALAARQMRRFGGMLSFELHGGRDAASHVVRSTRLFAFAASLGGVESLIGHPASMTHVSLSAQAREAIGITDGLVRVSAGVEDPGDLERDLIGAISGLQRKLP